MAKTIRMVIEDGEVSIEAEGFPDATCLAEAEALLEALDIPDDAVNRKPEADRLTHTDQRRLESES